MNTTMVNDATTNNGNIRMKKCAFQNFIIPFVIDNDIKTISRKDLINIAEQIRGAAYKNDPKYKNLIILEKINFINRKFKEKIHFEAIDQNEYKINVIEKDYSTYINEVVDININNNISLEVNYHSIGKFYSRNRRKNNLTNNSCSNTNNESINKKEHSKSNYDNEIKGSIINKEDYDMEVIINYDNNNFNHRDFVIQTFRNESSTVIEKIKYDPRIRINELNNFNTIIQLSELFKQMLMNNRYSRNINYSVSIVYDDINRKIIEKIKHNHHSTQNIIICPNNISNKIIKLLYSEAYSVFPIILTDDLTAVIVEPYNKFTSSIIGYYNSLYNTMKNNNTILSTENKKLSTEVSCLEQDVKFKAQYISELEEELNKLKSEYHDTKSRLEFIKEIILE